MLSCHERAASQRACGLAYSRARRERPSSPHRAAPYRGCGGRSGELASAQEAATHGGYRERGEASPGVGGYEVMIVGCKLGAKHGEHRLSPSGGETNRGSIQTADNFLTR